MAKKLKISGLSPGWGSFSARWLLHNLPFVFFLSFLATIYIANAHLAERQVRNIQRLQREVKELRREYNALQSELMTKSKLSEVGKNVEAKGLKKSAWKPRTIVVHK
ncbi:MAG: hypothetical protein D6714_10950 [Bacteroidetes bacterium]|nr:MAG: hypothetical protein D6714_10950 [Bacteroidota bacterium]